MKQVEEFHKNAMELSDQAFLYRLQGRLEEADKLFQEAFNNERKAAKLVESDNNLEPTRSVLHRSAASLAIDCGKFRDAEKLISMALTGNPPNEIAEELRNLWNQIFFLQHLSQKGITLDPNEFQISLSGEAFGQGIALHDVYNDQINNVKRIVYRIAERKLGLPYREVGGIKKFLKKDFEFYVSAPISSSFAISFRIGSKEQLTLGGVGIGEEVINEFMDCIELFSKSNEEDLKNRIEQEPYYRNFIGLARNISPDGKKVKRVGFTITRGKIRRAVILDKTKDETLIASAPDISEEKKQPVQVVGLLKYADSRKEKQEGIIRLIDKKHRSHQILVPEGMMADIVRPMYEFEVQVTGYKVGRKIRLEDIEKIE